MPFYTEFCTIEEHDGLHKISLSEPVKNLVGPRATITVEETEFINKGRLGIVASGGYGAAQIPFPVSAHVVSIVTGREWYMLVDIINPAELDTLSRESISLEI